MLTKNNFLPLNFVAKEDFTGSYKGMRFMLHKEMIEDERKLKAYVWSEPFSFSATPDEDKISEIFDFNEDGLNLAIDWMNENYEKVRLRNC